MTAVRLDLHCHSRHSDGTDTAAEVARKAAAAGVALFCLTDHDTDGGTSEAMAVLEGRSVLRGAELSCSHAGRTVHLLLLGIGEGEGRATLDAAMAQLRDGRRTRIHDICERFLRWNIRLDAKAILAAAGDAAPGRPHIARALVQAGVCSSVKEAFDRFLKDGGPADVKSPRIEVAEGVALGRAAGARVALAHPHTVGHPHVVGEMCKRLKPSGLEGLEAVYGPYAARVRADWTAFADDLGLVVTAGSDYHGAAVTPEISGPGMDLDETRAGRLRDWLGV